MRNVTRTPHDSVSESILASSLKNNNKYLDYIKLVYHTLHRQWTAIESGNREKRKKARIYGYHALSTSIQKMWKQKAELKEINKRLISRMVENTICDRFIEKKMYIYIGNYSQPKKKRKTIGSGKVHQY